MAETVTIGPSADGNGTTLFTITVLETGPDIPNENPFTPTVLSNLQSIRQRQWVGAASSGDITVPLPTTPCAPGWVLVQLPPSNSESITCRTVSGDTGTFVNPGGLWFVTFDQLNLPTNIIINVAGAVSGIEVWWG